MTAVLAMSMMTACGSSKVIKNEQKTQQQQRQKQHRQKQSMHQKLH